MKKTYSLPIVLGALVIGLVIGFVGMSVSNGSLLAGDLGRTASIGKNNSYDNVSAPSNTSAGSSSKNTIMNSGVTPVLLDVTCPTTCALEKKIDAIYALVKIHECEKYNSKTISSVNSPQTNAQGTVYLNYIPEWCQSIGDESKLIEQMKDLFKF